MAKNELYTCMRDFVTPHPLPFTPNLIILTIQKIGESTVHDTAIYGLIRNPNIISRLS